MSKKKSKSKTPPRSAPKTVPSNGTKPLLIFVAVLIVVGLGVYAANSAKPKGAASPVGAAGTTSAAAAPAEEQKYIGRLLPAGYQEPSVQPVTYSGVTNMTDVTVDAKGANVSVSLADITKNKIVYFEYQKAGGEAIPMVAYVKPSGKVFVGVSFCIPCKGKKQFVDADGTLTCSSCGTKRDIETGVGISGACRLYPLDEIASTIAGDQLVIEKSALDKWTPQPTDRPVG